MEPVLRDADLHVHTNFSDGTASPSGVVAAAVAAGLGALAITDHDHLAGIRPAQQAAADTDLLVVPGVEVAALCDGAELHLVGLFVDPHSPRLRARTAAFRQDRVERIHEMVVRLSRSGAPISAQEVFHAAGKASPGRPHVAEILRRHGYVPTSAAAFQTYIGEDGPGYVPRLRPPPSEQIALIREAGGVAVLAHPGLTGRDDLIPRLVADGLQAIEAFCPTHSTEDTDRYLALAHRHDLAVGGGSDFHGIAANGPQIGSSRVAPEFFESLCSRSSGPRSAARPAGST